MCLSDPVHRRPVNEKYCQHLRQEQLVRGCNEDVNCAEWAYGEESPVSFLLTVSYYFFFFVFPCFEFSKQIWLALKINEKTFHAKKNFVEFMCKTAWISQIVRFIVWVDWPRLYQRLKGDRTLGESSASRDFKASQFLTASSWLI